MPALILSHGRFRVALGERLGKPGCWPGTKGDQGSSYQRVWKYFNILPIAKAELASSGLAYRLNCIKILWNLILG